MTASYRNYIGAYSEMFSVNHGGLIIFKNSNFEARNDERESQQGLRITNYCWITMVLERNNSQQFANQLNVIRKAITIRLKPWEKIQEVQKCATHELVERRQ